MNNHKKQIEPGFYRHYKGEMYRIIGFTTDATNERNNEILVHYIASYGNYETYSRTLAEFTENVEYEGKTMPRFTFEREADVLF